MVASRRSHSKVEVAINHLVLARFSGFLLSFHLVVRWPSYLTIVGYTNTENIYGTHPCFSASEQINFAKEEEKVLDFWREINAFETSLNLTKGRPEFIFYDGPPFATGLPHYGILLSMACNDFIKANISQDIC